MKADWIALAAASMAGAASAQGPPPAENEAAAHLPQREWQVSAAERAAVGPLLGAQNAALAARAGGETADWAAVQPLLAAAEAAAQGNDARYLVARAQLVQAINTENAALRTAALDALIASPATLPDGLPRFLNARTELAFAARDFATAERLTERLLQLSPGDQRLISNLAVIRQRMGNSEGALDTILQNIAAREAAGGPAPEDLYRRARDVAYRARDRRAAELATRLARHYPSAANWRDAIGIYRRIAGPGGMLVLDMLRLTRAVGALERGTDYLAYADALEQAGLPGETKAVLDEGIARGAIRAGDPAVARLLGTADRRIAEDRSGLPAQTRQARAAATGRLARTVGDALYGYGRYDEAAELYRVALGKTGEDATLLNLRLGAALAMAGDRAAAETALRAVSGPGADLAQLWLAWLSRRTG